MEDSNGCFVSFIEQRGLLPQGTLLYLSIKHLERQLYSKLSFCFYHWNFMSITSNRKNRTIFNLLLLLTVLIIFYRVFNMILHSFMFAMRTVLFYIMRTSFNPKKLLHLSLIVWLFPISFFQRPLLSSDYSSWDGSKSLKSKSSLKSFKSSIRPLIGLIEYVKESVSMWSISDIVSSR